MASKSKRSDFVFDQLICYLSNPLFQLPVLSFIEEHCLIFDPSVEDSPMYKPIHDTYRHVIDNLLKSFRKDTGLTAEEIYSAMKDWNTKSQFKDFRGITDLILACEDYAIFVRIMIQKNLELQQQALMMIAQVMGGALPASLVQDTPQPPNPRHSDLSDEDKVLNAVIQQSKAEYELELKRKKKEDKDLHIIIAVSKVENDRIEQVMRSEQDKLAEAVNKSLSLTDTPSVGHMRSAPSNIRQDPPKVSSVPPPAAYQPKRAQASSKPKPVIAQHNVGGPNPGLSSSEAAAAWLKSAETEFNTSDAHSRAVQKAAATMADMSEEEYKKRAEFLRQQRDKLMEMKKREREKQLLSVEKSHPQRPASARAARAALNQHVGDGSNVSAEDEKKLAMRRAIADRLKSELINKK